MRPIVIIAIATAFLAGSSVRAASPEDDYLAARQTRLAAVRAAETAKKSDEELHRLDDAGREDLKARLLALFGTSVFPGVPKAPVYQPETLLDGSIESGSMDGLRYASEDGFHTWLVTSEKILTTWAAERSGDLPAVKKALRSGITAVLSTDDVFTFAVGADAAFEGFADLPVVTEPGTFGRAVIGAFAQDVPASPPDTVAVAVLAEGRIVIATVPAETAVADPKVCAPLKAKSDRRYLGCVAKALKQSPQFATLTRQAQTLLASARGK